jgi:hypothetical protein
LALLHERPPEEKNWIREIKFDGYRLKARIDDVTVRLLTRRGLDWTASTPNMHDILTGTQTDGTAFPAGEDRTCGNWTLSGAEGAVMVGHSDRTVLDDSAPAKSWSSSHPSRGGCSPKALRGTGGHGVFLLFLPQID